MTRLFSMTLLTAVVGLHSANANAASPGGGTGLTNELSNEDAWKRLPKAETGQGQPLPSWARMMVGEVPRSTAAFLQLDLAQRTKSPINPKLRAAMRWIPAHANHSSYAEAYAIADAKRAGLDDAKLKALSLEGYPGWSDAEKAALTFAYKMTVASDTVTDAEFAILVKNFGENQAASMVLLLAYANFQDRLLICLGAPIEEGGPLPPVEVSFAPESFTTKALPPHPAQKKPLPKPTGTDLVQDDPSWASSSYESLQVALEAQRRKPTRLAIPEWDQVAKNLPEGAFKNPSDIIWYRIVFKYAPELAVPFDIYMRTAAAETDAKWDRIFGQSLFWVVTRAINCPYCMGHCEMTWEVAGLTKADIAERSRILAGDDWSSFSPAEQNALAFARKLTNPPGTISRDDIDRIKHDFGADRALILVMHASRFHYMTRISNGFQLKLESENVFFKHYNMKPTKVSTTPVTQ